MTRRIDTKGWRRLALVSFRVRRSEPDKVGEGAYESKRKPPILINNINASKKVQRAVFEALLQNQWLAKPIRNAIVRELGMSVRGEQRRVSLLQDKFLRAEIDERVRLLKASGEGQPHGGYRDAAIEYVSSSRLRALTCFLSASLSKFQASTLQTRGRPG